MKPFMIHLVTAAKMEDSYNEQLQTENITNHYPLFARVQRQRPVRFSSGLRERSGLPYSVDGRLPVSTT